MAPAERGPSRKRKAHPATDAPYAIDADLSETQHEQACERPQDLPLPALPMRKGFLYLVAIMDWFTRKVLAWRISNTLEAEFCLEALNEAIHKFGPPEIMNTDQGSQFTSFDWTDRLKRAKTKISMDGKARYLDNIFIERLWRSLKYECVYLHAWETGSQARVGIGRWITFYNHQRPHTAHGGQPPAVVYFNSIETDQQMKAVA
jgi:putative transposase